MLQAFKVDKGSGTEHWERIVKEEKTKAKTTNEADDESSVEGSIEGSTEGSVEGPVGEKDIVQRLEDLQLSPPPSTKKLTKSATKTDAPSSSKTSDGVSVKLKSKSPARLTKSTDCTPTCPIDSQTVVQVQSPPFAHSVPVSAPVAHSFKSFSPYSVQSPPPSIHSSYLVQSPPPSHIQQSIRSPQPFQSMSATPNKSKMSDYYENPPDTIKYSDPSEVTTVTESYGSEDTLSSWHPTARSPPGSKENPHKIHVNPRYPERHQEFDIQEVNAIEHNRWIRKGFHIRTDIGLKDKEHWRAWMVDIAGYKNRAIMVKGRSRKSFYDENGSYHRRNFCRSTRRQHCNTTQDIKDHEDRWYTYWVLLFPPGVMLDNVIISGDPTQLRMQSIGVHETMNGIQTASLVIYWVIAQRSGGLRQPVNEANDLDNDFAN